MAASVLDSKHKQRQITTPTKTLLKLYLHLKLNVKRRDTLKNNNFKNKYN